MATIDDEQRDIGGSHEDGGGHHHHHQGIMTARTAAAVIAVANVRGLKRRGVLLRVRDPLSRQGTCARRIRG